VRLLPARIARRRRAMSRMRRGTSGRRPAGMIGIGL
jgi:hypothetical protein